MKALRLMFGIFLFIGLLFMVIAGFVASSSQEKIDTYIQVEGIVIDLEQSSSSSDNSYTYFPVVEYTADDGNVYSFRSSVGSSPPSYEINETVTVMHPPDQPQSGQINDFTSLWLVAIIFGGLGFVFFAVGLGGFIHQKNANKRKEFLLRNGQKITANVTAVTINRNLTVNGRNPFRITCQRHESSNNTVHTFESENIWFDPSSFAPQGKEVTVYVDYTNPKKYYVDISFLPKQA